MAIKKGVLGRGLDAILLDNSEETEKGASVARISDIEPNPDQPRKNFDNEDLSALADSITEYGVIQPITVRKVDGRYQIIAGERRWRAARMAGLSEVPITIINADDKKASEISLVENIQRKNLDPIEEAEAFSALIEGYGLTQEEVARRIGRSRSSVTNSLRLLDLPPVVMKYVAEGSLSEGHAKALLGLKDKSIIENTADNVILRALSVRETEKLVRELNAPPKAQPEKKVATDLDYTRQLERSVSKQLGRPVRINQNGDKSTISIGFSDNNDLDVILRLLCGDDFVDSL